MVICNISGNRSFHWYLVYQILTNPDRITDVMLFQKIKSLNGGYLDNAKHLLLIFWLCNIKKLNFRHFNTNSKKFTVTVVFFFREKQNGSRKANIILSSISRSFRLFVRSEDYRRCRKAVEDVQRQQNIYEEKSDNFPRARKNYQCSIYLFIYLFIFHEQPSKH